MAADKGYITRGTVNFDAIIGDTTQFDTLSIGPGASGNGVANFNSGDPVQVTNLIIGSGTIQGPGDITITGLTTWNAGTVVKSAGPGTATIRGTTTNTGTVEVQSDVLSFTGSYGGSYIQTAGQTVLNGGDLCMSPSAPTQVNGGLLTGSGAVTANALHNGGTTAPGLSAGVIDVVNNYIQTATGTLEIEIDGPNQGSEYDLLTVTGAATLAGHLEVIFPDGGFAPAPGDSYQILVAGSVGGQFDTVNVVNLSPYLSMVVVYSPNDVTLDIVGVVAGDCDLDGDADLDDYLYLEGCFLGPGTGIEPECRCFDSDDDGDVDLIDFAEFQPAFTGQ